MAKGERAGLKLANRKDNRDKSPFEVGQRLMLQNAVGNGVWEEQGTNKEIRKSGDKTIQSYILTKNSGNVVVRNKRYFKPLSGKRVSFAENLTHSLRDLLARDWAMGCTVCVNLQVLSDWELIFCGKISLSG